MPTTRSAAENQRAPLRVDDRTPSPPPSQAYAHALESPRAPEFTFTQESFSAFLQSQTEAFRDALQCVVAQQRCSTPGTSEATFPGTLARCKSTFGGRANESVDAFIDAVESYADCAQVSDLNIIRGLSMLLVDDAATWWQGLKDTISTWPQAKENLISAYGDRRPPHRIYLEIFSSPHKPNEKTDLFVARIRALMSRLPKEDLSEKARLDITYGLLNGRIRQRLRRDDFSAFTELLRHARNIEDSLNENDSCPSSEPARARAAAPFPLTMPPSPPPPQRIAKHSGAEPATSSPASRPTRSSVPALHHVARPSCAVPDQDAERPVNKRPICSYCKRYGHSKLQCRKLSRSEQGLHSSYTHSAADASNKFSDGFCSIKSYCVSNTRCSSNNNLKAKIRNCSAKVRNYKNVNFKNECTTHNIVFCNNCYDYENGLLRGNRPGTPNDLGHRRPIFKIEILGISGTALIDTAAKHCIAGYTLYALLQRKGHPLVPATRVVKLADGIVREMEVLTTTLNVKLVHKIITIPFLIFPQATNNETLLGIDFISAAEVGIDFHKKNWYFSRNAKVKYQLHFEPMSNNNIACAATEILRDDEGSHLQPAERKELADTLVRYSHVFRAGGGPTPFAEHRIDTGEHPPISVPPYRLNPTKKNVMKKEINKMLHDEIIEECESAWSSPALLVPKSNGGIRFCVDYRRLNAITKSDTYPMPRIDELLQSTKRNCYMSTLDLQSSYWQVSVHEDDRDKTAFVCPLGTYRFKRMPFGLKNAPATFQRLIDRLRSCAALKDVTILGYLDDLLVISEGFQQHLRDLDAVFKRLVEFHLHVNRDKCAFARASVKYLGHIITQEGVSTDPDKVSAVLDMEEPKNLKHLRTFLQTCSWFRKFIPNFSKVAEPLTRLTRKSQVWIWSAEQVQAFLELKRLLTTAPILVQADFNNPFIVRTDASNYALGAVLLQGEGNQERPIEYASRLLNAAERNYSTTEREALAVVWAVERFRAYLDGQPVIVGSDHQPLRWLLSLKSPTGRLVRWALKLQSFDIRFHYTPGKANVVADTLSRPACSEESRDSCGVCSIICDLPNKKPSDLRQMQVSDSNLVKIINELEGVDEIAAQRWSERGFLMDQGVLFRHNPDSDCESPQLVVAADQVSEILKDLHDSPTAGHPGIDRTYQKVAQLFYFTGMRRIISNYVKACIHCQRYKAANAKPPGLLQTPVMNQRNEVLAIDLFGPLPEGDQGERWIFLIEDTATRWTELFALKEASAEACAKILIEEYFMRYGLPRRIISDNGVQFVSALMRQCMLVLDIKQNLIPLYHPQANPAERKNRDLKALLSQLVEEDHTSWPKHLPVIRFALNSAPCRTTGVTPAYLTFAREMRSPTEVTHDIRSILDKENFIPQITPYLRKFIKSLAAVRERVETQQDKSKESADASRRPADAFQVGDLVLLKSHVLSNTSKDLTSKFVPRRDGPYRITDKVSPTTFKLAHVNSSNEPIGRYHVEDITRYQGNQESPPEPVIPKKKRGRPVRVVRLPVQERGRSPELEGEHVANRRVRLTRGRLPRRYAV